MTFTMDSGRDCVLAWETMPHALQGNLTPQQGDWLDGHLACCEACREQFAQQQRLQRAMALPVDLPVEAEAGLQRLLSRIDDGQRQAPPGSLLPAGLAGRLLVAAVLLQAIGLGVIGGKLWSLDPAPEYRTLSAEAAPMPAGAIRLVPDPGLTVADWDAVLDANGLRVVAGPNAVGGYTVVSQSEISRRETLVRRLRATRGILMAEPVAGVP